MKKPPKYPKDKQGRVISPVPDIYGQKPPLKKGKPVENMTGADPLTDTLRAAGEAIKRPFTVKNAAEGTKRVVQDFKDVSGYNAGKKLGASVGKRPALGAKGLAAAKKGKR